MIPIQSINDAAFKVYGRILDLDTKEFCQALNAIDIVAEGTMYEPATPVLEALPIFATLQETVYGDLPIQLGHCSGHNQKLNAVEYHRSSEVDIAATDIILLIGRQQDIDYTDNTYATAKIEAFLVPAGTAVELYGTTLHFAPCGIDGSEFRCGVVLPRGTNEALSGPIDTTATDENRLLFAKNKWLIAHAESGLDKDGAYIGLQGDNISI